MARLVGEYGTGIAVMIGLNATFNPIAPGYSKQSRPPRDPKMRQVMAKLKNVETFGVVGCYPPGVLGWKIVPPFVVE